MRERTIRVVMNFMEFNRQTCRFEASFNFVNDVSRCTITGVNDQRHWLDTEIIEIYIAQKVINILIQNSDFPVAPFAFMGSKVVGFRQALNVF